MKNLIFALIGIILIASCNIPSQSRDGQGLKIDSYGRLSTKCLQRNIKHVYTIGGQPLQNTVQRLNNIGKVVAINNTDSSVNNMPLIIVCYRLNAY